MESLLPPRSGETVQNLGGEQNRKNVIVEDDPVSRRISFSLFDVGGHWPPQLLDGLRLSPRTNNEHTGDFH
jgi:hypothetical protein